MSLQDIACRVEAIEAGWIEGGKASIPTAAAALEKVILAAEWSSEQLDAAQALLIRLALVKKCRTRATRPRREPEPPLAVAEPAHITSTR
jgi:hypothetical protein